MFRANGLLPETRHNPFTPYRKFQYLSYSLSTSSVNAHTHIYTQNIHQLTTHCLHKTPQTQRRMLMCSLHLSYTPDLLTQLCLWSNIIRGFVSQCLCIWPALIWQSFCVCLYIGSLCVYKRHVPANATQLNEERVWNGLCVSDKSEIKGKAKDRLSIWVS